MGRRRPPRDGTSTPTTRVQNTNSPTEEDPTRAGRGNDKDGFDHVGRHTGTTMGGRQARPTMDFRRHTTGGRRRLYRTPQDLTGRRPGQMDGARAQPDDRRSRPYPPGRPKPTQEYCIADGRGRRRYTHMGPGRLRPQRQDSRRRPITVPADALSGRRPPPDGVRRVSPETPLLHHDDGRGTPPQPSHQPITVGNEGRTSER